MRSGPQLHYKPVLPNNGLKIPVDWDVSRIDFVATVKARLGWKGLTADEYVNEGFIFLSTPNIKGEGEIDFENVNFITKDRYIESPEIMLRVGDVLIAKDGSTLGITNVIRNLPAPATVNSSIAVIRPRKGKEVECRYLFRWLSSAVIQGLIHRMKDGQGVPHLFQADIKKFPVILPPKTVQTTVADFLDRKTGEIDALVAKKRALIEKLKEKRSALISRTVIRGLPPEAARAAGLELHPKMKPSGIEWLGDVPEHWAVRSLKYYFPPLESGVSVNAVGSSAMNDEVGVLKTSCVFGDIFRSDENKRVLNEEIERVACPVSANSLIISRMNTPELVGSCGFVDRHYPNLYLPDRLWIARFKSEQCPTAKYLWYLITSANIKSRIAVLATGTSGSMKNLAQWDFLHLPVAMPNAPERAAIAQFLDRETVKIDALIAKVEQAVERLQEYRTAVITAAITGKIDVRNATDVGGTEIQMAASGASQ